MSTTVAAPSSTVLFSVLFLTRASSHARSNHVHPNGQLFVCGVQSLETLRTTNLRSQAGTTADETMGIKRALPRYGCQFPAIVRELPLLAFHNHSSPFCAYPNTARILTLEVPSIPLRMSTRCCAPLLRCSVSGPDLRMAFPSTIMVYRCTVCNQTYLKPCAGLRDWQEMAAQHTGDPLLAAVSSLPVVKCKQNAGTDTNGVPLGVCDRCYSRAKRARRGKAGGAALEAEVVVRHSTPQHTPTRAAPISPKAPPMGYAPTAADTTHAQTPGACSHCPILRERI